MSLAAGRAGVSALFDAIIFFLLVSAACAALFHSASINTGVGRSPVDMGRLVSDTMACALDATVGPVDYVAGGDTLRFSGNALGAIGESLRVQSSFNDWNTTGLEDSVRGVLAILVERPYHFLLAGELHGKPASIFISDAPGMLGGMSAGRWSCSVPLDVGGMEGELTLYMWR